MSVFSYEENGQMLWRYYLNLRSKKDPKIRFQRIQRGFASRKEAEKEERFQFLQLSAEISRLESIGATWEHIIGRWEVYYRTYPSHRYALTTIMDHVSLVTKWTEAWLRRPASELTRGDGRLLLSQLHDLEKSVAYQKRLKSAINTIYTWGIDERLIVGPHHSPVFGVETAKREQEKLPEILTHEQVQKLLFEAKLRRHPWYPVWATTCLTGCRSGEAIGLRHEDIELVSPDEASRQMLLPSHERDFGLIRLTRSWNSRINRYGPLKARYWRNIPVSSELYGILTDLKKENFGSDEHGRFLLPQFSQWKDGNQAQVIRAFCREIGIPAIKFHTLRACFATHLISRGVPSATVMKICGWRDLKTAQRYIRLAGVDERGATEGLDFVPTEQGVMEKVVSLYDYRQNERSKL